MADESVTDTVTHNNQRIDVAYKILRELNDGREPYAGNVMPMVRALALYAEEIRLAFHE